MISAWVIPYKTAIHVQVKFDLDDAQQLLEELDGIDEMDGDLMLKKLRGLIEEKVVAGRKLSMSLTT